jgi:nucleoside-diphosphate-sugar epimerase
LKTVLITGASGCLGSNLIAKLLDNSNVKVIAVLGRTGDKANMLPQKNNLVVYSHTELFSIELGHVDALIHAAFSRGDNLSGLTSSIDYTRKIIELVNHRDIDSVLNISTQGVYPRLKKGEKVTEDGSVAPNTTYGLAKWAVENMLKVGCRKHFTNIRMASLNENAKFLNFFVESVIAHKKISITAPRQYASIMDVSDAVDGIIEILQLPIKQRNEVYNLGPGEQYSILDYAQSVNEIWKSMGHTPTDITIDDSGIEFATCMDCSSLEQQTGWKPKVTKNMMLQTMLEKKNIEKYQ